MSKIEWCDVTWNPITGCSPISEGCQNCYAKRMANRLRGRFGYPEEDPFRIEFHPDKFDLPLRWKKSRKIFVCSMGDLFHVATTLFGSPFNRGINYVLDSYICYTNYPMRDAIFAVMERAKHHTFMLLTKRPENMKLYFDAVQKHKKEYADKFKLCPTIEMQNSTAAKDARLWAKNPIPKNLWPGVTIENQKRADERIPVLLQIPAAVRFVSVEPMLGPVDLSQAMYGKDPVGMNCFGFTDGFGYEACLQWIIAGPETGPKARLCKPEWIEDLYEQCKAANIPFFDKRKTGWIAREFPKE